MPPSREDTLLYGHFFIAKGVTTKERDYYIRDSNMTSFKRFESKPVVKIILIYDRLNLWRHRQFITIFYQFLHIRIKIIHGSHMYILFLPRVDLCVTKFYPERIQIKWEWMVLCAVCLVCGCELCLWSIFAYLTKTDNKIIFLFLFFWLSIQYIF